MLRVNEIFGPTIQGEGPSAGRNAMFLRLAGCNLDCAWCDTPYSWDWKGVLGTAYKPEDESHKMSVDDVRDALLHIGAPLLVVTGGEPMLQQRSLSVLTQQLSGLDIEIETNGTIPPLDDWWDTGVAFNVSPKLANSDIRRSRRIRPDALISLGKLGAILKPVVSSIAELGEVHELQEMMQVPDRDVWVMPLGVAPAILQGRARELAEEVISRNWNLTGRMHAELWEGQRGR